MEPPHSVDSHFSDGIFREREKLLGMSAISFIVVFFLTRFVFGGRFFEDEWSGLSVGTVLLSAVMLGCAVIALHGATRMPDDLFIDDSQVQSIPLLAQACI